MLTGEKTKYIQIKRVIQINVSLFFILCRYLHWKSIIFIYVSMDNFDLSKFKHIHFVGIGGISMYLLAIYCKDFGIKVSGSDIHSGKYTNICRDNNIKVYIGHRRSNINGADLVVHTSAVDRHNVEICEAYSRGVKVIDRADLLAYICTKYKHVIGISGTHGKTTTSAMIYHILRESGKKVSCHIGADIDNAKLDPNDEYLVLECCEYNKSFLKFPCNIGVVLNIDNDHLDCYGNMYNLRNAFKTFLKRAKTRFVFDNATTTCIKTKAIRIKPSEIVGINKFIYNDRKFVLDNVYGEHNINNATVAVGVCLNLGLSYSKISKALKTFKPAGRRCQVLGKIKNCDIITDYAHHPSEIECMYNSLKLKYDQVYIIFQPHTYSRTKLLLHEFVKFFSGKDNVYIFKEYSARESKNKGYSAKQLCEYLDNATYIKNYRSLKKVFDSLELMDKSCVALIGAGDINEMGVRLIKENKDIKQV